MSDYDPFHDSDEDYERSRREHLVVWHGPSRFTFHCPVCGRGLWSVRYLELPHWRSDGLKVCSSCREHERRIGHTEEKRRAIK